MYNSRTIAISIARPVDEVFSFLIEPLNLPKWAFVGYATMRHLQGSDWEVETSIGRRILRLARWNRHGILDHYAMLNPGDEPLPIPMRVVANGEGTELLYTSYQRPGISDAEWQSTLEWITTDLMTLKSLLEYRSSELAAAS